MISVSFGWCVRVRVRACVCWFSFFMDIGNVLVHGIHSTCLPSNKNPLRICQNNQCACKKFVFLASVYLHYLCFVDNVFLSNQYFIVTKMSFFSFLPNYVVCRQINIKIRCMEYVTLFHALFGLELYVLDRINKMTCFPILFEPKLNALQETRSPIIFLARTTSNEK